MWVLGWGGNICKTVETRDMRAYCPFRDLQIAWYICKEADRENMAGDNSGENKQKSDHEKPQCALLKSWNPSWKQWRTTKNEKSRVIWGEHAYISEQSLQLMRTMALQMLPYYLPHYWTWGTYPMLAYTFICCIFIFYMDVLIIYQCKSIKNL